MLKDLLGNRIRVGLARIQMREIPDADAQIEVHFEDTITGKAADKFLRIEFTRHVWFDPASVFDITATYFVEHDLKQEGSLAEVSQEQIDEEIRNEPGFYIQENQGFVGRISMLISQITASFGGAPLITPPSYSPEVQ